MKQKFNYTVFCIGILIGLFIGGISVYFFNSNNKTSEITLLENPQETNTIFTETVTPAKSQQTIEEIPLEYEPTEDSSLYVIEIEDPNQEEDIAQDQLIAQKKVAVYSYYFDENGEKPILEHINISFWKSPVNYKGYKRGEKNLVLFGIDTLQNFRLEKSNDSLWLFQQNQVYLLEKTAEFNSFQRIK